MRQNISTLDVRRILGDLLNRVALRNDEFIIERKGKPLAAMVPVAKLERLQRLAGLALLDAMKRKLPIGRRIPRPAAGRARGVARERRAPTGSGRRRGGTNLTISPPNTLQ